MRFSPHFIRLRARKLTTFELCAEGFGYREVEPNNLTARDGTQGWPLFTPRQTAAMVAGFYDQQPETAGTNFVRSCLPCSSSLKSAD